MNTETDFAGRNPFCFATVLKITCSKKLYLDYVGVLEYNIKGFFVNPTHLYGGKLC